MPDKNKVTSVVIAGIGGQGVVKASDILAEAAFYARFDVKKSEVHGMSQRGGSVTSDVRFGARVLSPMVPPGQADFLVVLEESELPVNRTRLRRDGLCLSAGRLYDDDRIEELRAGRNLNVAMLGALSAHLPIPEHAWISAIRASLPARVHETNTRVFRAGRIAEKLMNHVARLA